MRGLVLFIHGWLLKPKALEPLRDLLQDEPELSPCDVAIFGYDARRYSNVPLETVSRHLSDHLERLQSERGYEQIILVGHSMGGLVARRAYLDSSPYGKESTRRAWGALTTKIVLIATPNRGSSRLDYHPLERIGSYLMEFMGRARLVRGSLRGSSFVTNLRLDWVSAFRAREDSLEKRRDPADGSSTSPQPPPVPHIVQLVCGKDERVELKDNLDVEQFGNLSYEQIDDETHESVIRIKLRRGKIRPRDETKYKKIRDAIISPAPPANRRGYLANTDLGGQRITDTVFIIHGIRTRARWTTAAEAAIERREEGWDVRCPAYGYFALIKFLWGPTRQACVSWFRDQYAQAMVANPLSRFHFVGHSNGTYILSSTLEQFESIRFDRAYLAGSVVRADFDWTKHIERGQLGYLRNDCAARDLPVGLLCAGLRRLGFPVGVAGYRGFADKHANIYQNLWLGVTGLDGHSVALNRANFKTIRAFLTGNPAEGSLPPESMPMTPQSSAFMEHLYRHAPHYLVAAVFMICMLLVAAYHLGAWIAPNYLGGWSALGLCLILLWYLLWRW